MTFLEALIELESGKAMRRKAWAADWDCYIHADKPRPIEGGVTLESIWERFGEGEWECFQPTFDDVRSDDWEHSTRMERAA
jgi:hypothetical protein